MATRLFRLSIGICFFGGFLTSLVSLLVPRLKLLFNLDYAQSLLVQLAFHSSYLLFAIPIAAFIVRAGYMRSIATGLVVMVLGCLGFVQAHALLSFVLVLLALLLLSVGITFLQIAANAVVTVVGPASSAASRLTLLQGFNSLGTVAGPLLCAQFLLPRSDGSFAVGGAGSVVLPFMFSAVGLLILAGAFAFNRNMLSRTRTTAPSYRNVLSGDRKLQFGIVAMFAYVGAEVTIGALLTNYLMLKQSIGAEPVAAGRMVALYWGGAMVGRFAGAFLLRRVSSATMLLSVSVGATALTCVGALFDGPLAAAALLAVGLCNAVIYPTVYAIALPEKAQAAPIASMFLCMAVVGGAIIPYLTGLLADRIGLGLSLLLPAACYFGIALFARFAVRATR
ncbi:MFS transporter [Sphingomonas sp.]|uniref:MFS transporter n=1 Tax=Sphingomonas sp. TaxID=28214 RepID=UPI0025F58203|nr:MFS transporter [Sphingomonas sp.]